VPFPPRSDEEGRTKIKAQKVEEQVDAVRKAARSSAKASGAAALSILQRSLHKASGIRHAEASHPSPPYTIKHCRGKERKDPEALKNVTGTRL